MKHLPKREIVPIGEAAKLLGVSIDTLRRWDKVGKITSVRPDGKNRFFKVTDIEETKSKLSGLLSISGAAKLLGISSSTLRRYEVRGLIKPSRNKKGERLYSLEGIKKFKKPKRVVSKPIVVQHTPAPKRPTTRPKQYLPPNKPGWRQYPSTFLVAVLLFTTILSTLYIQDQYKRNQERIVQAKAQVLGVADDTRHFFAGIFDFFRITNQNIISQHRKIITNTAKVIVEKTIQIDRVTETEKIVEVRTEGGESILEISSTDLIRNLNAEFVQGKKPGEEAGDLAYYVAAGAIPGLKITGANILSGAVSGGVGGIILDGSIDSYDIADEAVSSSDILNGTIVNADIADNAINAAKIENGTVGANELAGTLTFADGDTLDLSGIDHSSTSKMGLILPNVSSATPFSPSVEEGYLAYDTAGDQVLVFDGSAWTGIGGSVTLASGGGLEYVSEELTLNTSCSNDQIIKWNNATSEWGCGDDTGGAGSSLQGAYGSGNTLTTTNGRDITITLDDTATDSNYNVNIIADNTFSISRNNGSSSEVPAQILLIENLDTDLTITNGLLINVATGGVITDAIDVSDAQIANAINIGANNIVTAAKTLASTELDILDSGITLSELTDSGTLSASGTIDFADAGADTITIGDANDTTSIVGSSWSIGDDGATSGLSGITADAVAFSGVSGATNTNSLVIGTGGSLTISGTGTITATDLSCSDCIGGTEIDESGFGTTTVDSLVTDTGGITILAGQSIIPSVAGTLTIGDGNLQSLTVTTDATGDTEVQLPAGSISGTEILDDTVVLTTDTTGNYVAGATANEGLTLTGTEAGTLGIQLTSSGNTGLSTSNSGLEVGSAGLTLLKGCTDTYILKYTDAGGWACALDGGGGGGGTLQEAYDASSGNTITTTDARDITITLAELTNPTVFEIFNNDTAGVTALEVDNAIASGTLANGLLVEQSGAGTMTNGVHVLGTAGTITDGIHIEDGAGAITDGIQFTGTFTNLINSTNFSVTSAGALDIASTITAGSNSILVTDGTGYVYHDALADCGNTQILKWSTGGGRWGCAADASGGGGVFAEATGVITKVSSSNQVNLSSDEGGDYAILLDASVAPTVDLVQITNTGKGTVTDGVDGLVSTIYTATGAGANNSAVHAIIGNAPVDASDVINGLEVTGIAQTVASTIQNLVFVDPAASGNSSGTLYGINIDVIDTPGSATETAINIGSGWDTALVLQNGESINNSSDNEINMNLGTSGSLLLTSGTAATITNSAGTLTIDSVGDSVLLGSADSFGNGTWSISNAGVGTSLTATDLSCSDCIGGTEIDESGFGTTTVDSLVTDTGGITILAGQSIIPSVAGTLTIGDGNLQSLTVTTDATGDTEVQLPAGSISGTEILDDTVVLTTDTTGNYVAGATANEGLTLTGTEAGTLGIQLTSSGNTGLSTSNSGLEVGSAGLTLLKGCTDTYILKYTDAGGWACALDGGGGGGGTLQEAYDASSGNTITTTDARDITITLAELTNPTVFEIFNNDTAGVTALEVDNAIASGTLANGLLVEQSGAGTMTNGVHVLGTAGTITDGIHIEDGAGAITDGIQFTGTFTNLINSTNFSVTSAGAISAATATDTINGLIINSGAITGASTLGLSGAITGATATDTINGIVINSGALSGATTLNLSGAITGATATDTINGIVINSGAISSASTLGLSGAITGATATDTINGLIINSGALSGASTLGLSGAITGATATDTINGLVINSGAISSASTLGLSGAITGATATDTINGLVINSGALSGATTIAASSTMTIGSGGDTFTFDPSSGPTYAGNAMPLIKKVLSPEYPGATLFGDGGTNTGTMTSDYTNAQVTGSRATYYNWTTATATPLQDYDVVVRFTLPSNFDSWETGVDQAMIFDYVTNDGTAGNNQIDITVRLETLDSVDTTEENLASASWTTGAIDDSELTDCETAGEVCLIEIKMQALNNGFARVGDITLQYRAKF